MPQTENKVKFGLENVHFAVATIGDDNSATYATPKRVRGAVSLSMDPEGDLVKFRADNIDYWVGNGNNGYNGDLEMALFNSDFRTDILKEQADANGVTYESANAELVHFALLFEFKNDLKRTRHVLYNCTATRPAVASQTTEDSTEPQTESSTISAGSIHVPALEDDIVKASCKYGDTVYEDWFESVYIPTAAASGTGGSGT